MVNILCTYIYKVATYVYIIYLLYEYGAYCNQLLNNCGCTYNTDEMTNLDKEKNINNNWNLIFHYAIFDQELYDNN